MSFNPRATEELVFGETGLYYNSSGYPLTAFEMDKTFSIYQRDLFWDGLSAINGGYIWKEFLSNCLIELKVTNPGSGVETFRSRAQRFETLENFLKFVNDNLPNNGSSFQGDCQMRIFNKVEKSPTSVNKLNAQNTFYAVLHSTSRLLHNRSLAHMSIDRDRWGVNNYKTFIINAWKRIWDIDVTTVEYDLAELDWLGTAWVQGKKTRNLYNMPAINKNMEIKAGSSDGTRRFLVDNPNTLSLPDPDYKFNLVRKQYCYMDLNTRSVVWDSSPYLKTQQAYSWSGLTVFGLQRGEQKALYIKPLGGIDAVCVPKYDFNKYRLEAMYSAPQHRDRFRIVPVTTSDAYSFVYSNWINRGEFWLGGTGNANWHNSITKDIGRNVKFYLRKIGTDYVTPFNKMYIKAVRNADKNAGSGLDFLIETS